VANDRRPPPDRVARLSSSPILNPVLGLLAVIAGSPSCSRLEGFAAVPASHRAQGSACPPGRGASAGVPAGCSGSQLTDCTRDSDCTAGANGRCLGGGGGPACQYGCSYDDCSSDSDCTGHAPCVCRSSSADTAPNSCATESNCRVDADCGPGGFCSPSVGPCDSKNFCHADSGTGCSACGCPGSCGDGYFCHTPKDSCLDDNGCVSGMGCEFDLTSQSWMCVYVAVPL
jgi:hypothetical protein